jgi:DNA adenine methylase
LSRNVPRGFVRYIEPFLGGGALFFHLAPAQAIVADANPELMHFYRVARDEPEALFEAVSKMSVSKTEFYRVRRQEPSSLGPVGRAARFIYLNKTCFNGLYRVNKRGHFNTPFAGRTNVKILDLRDLWCASRILLRAELRCSDYKALLLREVGAGDFVYLDPPYIPIGRYSDFKRYTKEFFYERDHQELASVFRLLDDRGARVLLSISLHPTSYDLYRGYTVARVSARRRISCRPTGRGKVTELLISNYELEA